MDTNMDDRLHHLGGPEGLFASSAVGNHSANMNMTSLLSVLKSLTPDQYDQLLAMLGEPSIENQFNPNGPYERHLTKFIEFQIHKTLLLYVPPILIILGTFGNIFSFIILKRKAMLKFSTYFYLMVLAVADTLVLYIGLLQRWIGELTGFKLIDTADWICKTTNAVGYTISDFSVWLIIAVTAERYIVVCHPLKANAMCNTPRARNVILGLLAGVFLINIHFFWTVQIREFHYEGETVLQCHGTVTHEKFVSQIWPWVDVFVYSFLPFLAIMILNGLIIRQVILARRNRAILAEIGSGDYEQRRPSHEGSTRLTVMLLTISFAFLLTTLPVNIVNIAADFLEKQNNQPMYMHKVAQFTLARTITEMLMYCNHSMNFFLYCATGQKFRHQLVWMVCYAKRTYTWSWSEVSQNGTRLEQFRHGIIGNNKANRSRIEMRSTEMHLKVDTSPLKSLSDCSDASKRTDKPYQMII